MDPAPLQHLSQAWKGEPLPFWSLFQHMHCGQVGVQHICLPRYT